MKTIIICGWESVTLAHEVPAKAAVIRHVSLDYGRRHKTELTHARERALACPATSST